MATSFTVFDSVQRVHDFIKAEWEQRYSRVKGTIKNSTGADFDVDAIKPGTPLSKISEGVWETVDSGGESGIDGFYADSRKFPALANAATSTKKYSILVSGPALINLDKVPNDPSGDAYVTADLKTRIEALSPPIRFLLEPATTEEQTT